MAPSASEAGRTDIRELLGTVEQFAAACATDEHKVVEVLTVIALGPPKLPSALKGSTIVVLLIRAICRLACPTGRFTCPSPRQPVALTPSTSLGGARRLRELLL